MLEAEQMPLLGRGVQCQESCVLGRCRPTPRRAFGLTGRAAGSAATGGQPVGLMDRSDTQGCFWTSTCRSVASREASIRSSPEPEAPPPPQLSGQERSPTTLMGVWVPGRPAAAPGSSR